MYPKFFTEGDANPAFAPTKEDVKVGIRRRGLCVGQNHGRWWAGKEGDDCIGWKLGAPKHDDVIDLQNLHSVTTGKLTSQLRNEQQLAGRASQ